MLNKVKAALPRIQVSVGTSRNDALYAKIARNMLKGLHYLHVYRCRTAIDGITSNCKAAYPDDPKKAKEVAKLTLISAVMKIHPLFGDLHPSFKNEDKSLNLYRLHD